MSTAGVIAVAGARFGARTVVKELERRNGQRFVRVRCDCGRLDNVYAADLVAGRCDSCPDCRDVAQSQRLRSRKLRPIAVRCPSCAHCFTVRPEADK